MQNYCTSNETMDKVHHELTTFVVLGRIMQVPSPRRRFEELLIEWHRITIPGKAVTVLIDSSEGSRLSGYFGTSNADVPPYEVGNGATSTVL